MKMYVDPLVEIIAINTEDVIVTSFGLYDDTAEDNFDVIYVKEDSAGKLVVKGLD